jgi:hypothetical protein
VTSTNPDVRFWGHIARKYARNGIIGMIALLDNPYLGDLSVSLARYQLVYETLMKEGDG